MIYLKDFKQGKLLYEALDSDVRLGILEELLNKGELNLAYFAKRFNVSNGAITAHVKKLFEAGLIDVTTSSGIRGTQKICSLATDKIIVEFLALPRTEGRVESAHIDVGHYIGFEAHPTCGIATREKVLGRFDDPACFTYPERIARQLAHTLRHFNAGHPLAHMGVCGVPRPQLSHEGHLS